MRPRRGGDLESPATSCERPAPGSACWRSPTCWAATGCSPAPELAAGPHGARPPHLAAKARSVIWLFMEGGPGAMDTFDPKPELTRHHGRRPGASIDVFFGSPGPLMKSPFAFRRHGESGAWVCDRLPHLARHVDDLALIKSCYAESPAHGPAMYQMNTGMIRAGFPSAGSWVTYGLGTENQDLPGFVVLQNAMGSKGGAGNWGSGFLPSAYQATSFRSQGAPILNLERPAGMSSRDRQRRMLDLSARLNRRARRAAPRRGRPARPDPELRAGLPDAGRGDGGRRLRRRARAHPAALRPRRRRRRGPSARSACWPGGWSSAACGSCRSIATTSGTPTTTSPTTTASVAARPTSRSPAC